MANTIEVEYPDDDFRRDTYFINEADYDPDEHTLAEGQDAPTTTSDALEELVGATAAKGLAGAGLTTIEAAQAYEGDLTDIDGVGEATADKIAEA
jgi:predicted flap endonuclease-1-like 5' DNA nuclease